MIALVFELSSPQGSLALFRDGTLLGADRWPESRGSSRAVFDSMSRLLAEAGLAAGDVGLFVAGRGPGNYSGMRAALTLAQTLALPGGAEVRAVDSGAALARELLEENPERIAAIAGDARRDRCWLGVFEPADGGRVATKLEWRLCTPPELMTLIPAGAVAASSEFTRLSTLPGFATAAGVRWIRTPRFPDARQLGALALAERAAGRPSAPLSPIYLHPAVAERA